ncbi:MAG: hypothetical protein HY315_09390 [Acidobacteria bacterium]|nr:hypothetical protein [Acidobacteriota bacterium]
MEFKSLQKELDATTLYVTHDRYEARVLAEHGVRMQEGRIVGPVQIDAPDYR